MGARGQEALARALSAWRVASFGSLAPFACALGTGQRYQESRPRPLSTTSSAAFRSSDRTRTQLTLTVTGLPGALQFVSRMAMGSQKWETPTWGQGTGIPYCHQPGLAAEMVNVQTRVRSSHCPLPPPPHTHHSLENKKNELTDMEMKRVPLPCPPVRSAGT